MDSWSSRSGSSVAPIKIFQPVQLVVTRTFFFLFLVRPAHIYAQPPVFELRIRRKDSVRRSDSSAVRCVNSSVTLIVSLIGYASFQIAFAARSEGAP